MNAYGNEPGLSCASNQANLAAPIWDRRDADGSMAACVVVTWFADRYAEGADWRSLAWWIHDHLPYNRLWFFPKLAALNIQWHERPQRRIDSYIDPKGCLTKPGTENHEGSHEAFYLAIWGLLTFTDDRRRAGQLREFSFSPQPSATTLCVTNGAVANKFAAN